MEFLEARMPATVPAGSVGRFAAVKGLPRRPGRSGAVADGAALVEPTVGVKPVAWIVLTALDCRYAGEAMGRVKRCGLRVVARLGRHQRVLLRLLARTGAKQATLVRVFDGAGTANRTLNAVCGPFGD